MPNPPTLQLLDVVALLVDRPDHGLIRGQVGTVVEVFSNDAVEVEFVDDAGTVYAQLALPAEQLIRLKYKPQQAA